MTPGGEFCVARYFAQAGKLLAKGHVISEDDARMLETGGMNEVWVIEREEGEFTEDDGVVRVASVIGWGSLEIRLAAGGTANLFTTGACAPWWASNC
jgi:molybdenum cofactor cytidylyltransferase